MRPCTRVIVIVVTLVLWGRTTAAAPAPTTRPALDEKEVLRLVATLADPDATRRDAAAAKLRSMGKSAIPMLKRAVESGDPELAGRARAVIERIETRALPGGALPADGVTFSRLGLTLRGDGTTTIKGTFDGRTIELTEGEGITMTVTGMQDGKEESVTFSVADAESLKEESPEAHELYRRIMTTMRVENRGIAPLAFEEPMDVLRRQLERQMDAARTPADRRAEVLAQVAKLRELRVTNRDEGDDARDKKLKAFFESSDALRKTLAELKLDAGDLLPPPPNARLGVQLVVRTERLQVEKVVPGSRGEKIGLRPGDYIQRVNLKDVSDVDQLRAAVAAARGPLSVEVVRDQKSVTLEEKK